MTYNHRRLLQEVDLLVSNTPRIQLREIARLLGIDRHTIENVIRANRKISFREYQRLELLRNAQSMLDQSMMSIKEVGFTLGYSSPASFSRFIHKSTGKSPSQLRNNIGQMK